MAWIEFYVKPYVFYALCGSNLYKLKIVQLSSYTSHSDTYILKKYTGMLSLQ